MGLRAVEVEQRLLGRAPLCHEWRCLSSGGARREGSVAALNSCREACDDHSRPGRGVRAGTQHGTVAHYCKYGSRYQAQVNGCLSHVDSHDIERLNTDAAKFARGSSTSATSRRLAPTASTR